MADADAEQTRHLPRMGGEHQPPGRAREVPCAPVTDLDFQVACGPRLVPDRRFAARGARTEPAQPAAAGPLPDGLAGALEQVEDASLRGRLGQVMGRYLARSSGAL